MSEANYSIKAVAKLTGLTPHVIRVWEKRYGAVRPHRTDTNRRLYSDSDVHRLGMLRHATSAGHSIGNIATLPEERLAKLAVAGGVHEIPTDVPGAFDFTSELLAAVRQMDAQALEGVLQRALVALGQHGLLERIIAPAVTEIGERWRQGLMTAAHEHFATAMIRGFLARTSRPYAHTVGMPSLVTCTPCGQLHELGAVMVGAAANDLGWKVIYLGSSLPAAEIAGAAVQHRVRAVALSIVYPGDDPNLPAELEALRRYLPPEVKLLAGGRAVDGYRDVLNRIGAMQIRSLTELYQGLDQVRSS